MADPLLSIVATLYGSEAYIDRFVERASSAATAIVGDRFEIVLVNDGSPDNSLAKARRQVQERSYVRLVDLSRNFGHHKAMMSGLSFAKAERVFLIDVDLEEPPECLGLMWETMERERSDVVFGVQERRKGRFVERLGGLLFWELLARMTSAEITANPLTARLMTRRYVDALLLHKEHDVFIVGLFAITGFNQVSVPVKKTYRGVTSYSTSKRLKLAVKAVTSFSSRPLVWIFYFGAMLSFLSAIMAFWMMYRRLVLGVVSEGWTSIMVSVWLLGGITISFLGVIGIYLAHIFAEVKNRPYTIVREVYENDQE